MSTRDIAYSIFNQLSEKQLEGFIALFSDASSIKSGNDFSESDIKKGMAAFNRLQGMIKEIPDLDYDKEIAEYWEEKSNEYFS